MKRILGIDYGSKRVGLALSDPLGLTAQPLETVPTGEAEERIAELIEQHQVSTVVVGLPSPLSGGESESTRQARELGDRIGALSTVKVVFIDERFTTRMAESALLESGMKRRDRRSKVDKVAAAIILQTFLDGNFRRAGGVGDEGAL